MPRIPITARRLLLMVLLMGLAVGLCPAADSTSSKLETLGWNQNRPLKEYDSILGDFDPALTPVQVVRDTARGTITREGKGWLEVRDGRRILHLEGTPYEMGYQHGVLLKPEVRKLTSTILQVVGLYETARTGKPFINRLRETYKRCEPFIPPRYIEEARGIADGAGLSQETILLANIFPELFHCSGFALWGDAVADGKLYHGRILDYMNEIGLQNLAVVTVYKPDGFIPWVNVGYAGLIGSVTGMNARQVAFGEMGGGGEGDWDDTPMTYLMRKGLEEAQTLDQAVAIFRDTPRTCEYYYVISDAKIPSARGIAATPKTFDVVMPGEAHPRLPNPVKDTILMSAGDRYKRLVMRVEANYGTFTAPEALALMRRPVAMQSNLHSALFCPTDGRFWVANATADAQPAAEQPYAEYNLNELLTEKPE